MSKKKRKPTPKTSPSTPGKENSKQLITEFSTTEFQLIRFDVKTWAFIGICLALYFIFVALKWHNSSIGVWNTFANDGGDPKRGIIAGTPRPIRSDEWKVTSSFILSQYEKGFPLENKAFGPGKTPLAFGQPTDHILSKVKPAYWGYYFLDIERAFSWHWNFKLFPFLIACFLLLMLFTGNHFVLSVAGSVWLLLSSAIQWWSINTEMFTYGCLSIIGFLYILFGDRPHRVVAGGVVLMLAAYSYAMVLYPAYQVPFAYAMLAMIIGFTLAYRRNLINGYKQLLVWRVLVLCASLAGLGFLLYLFYDQAKETIEMVTNTVYPGKRSEIGGDFDFAKMFIDNFSLLLNENKIPPGFLNICELSSYLMLSLIPSLILIVEWIKKKKTDPVLAAILTFQVFILIWMLAGFPGFAAKWSLLSTSPSELSFFIFGFINVVFTLLFITRQRVSILPDTRIAKIGSFVAIFSLIFLIHYLLNRQVSSFFSSGQVFFATLLFTCLTWLLLHYHHGKIFQYLFLLLLFVVLIPNLRINPLSHGLSSYYENAIFKMTADIQSKDPEARWVVFNQIITPDFLKATGVNCFNGVKFVPPLEDLHILDPAMKYESVYNRYAHIACNTFIIHDSIDFILNQQDMYTLRVDPCSPRLVQLGLKYFMFTYAPNPIEVGCMTPVASVANKYIYKRNDL